MDSTPAEPRVAATPATADWIRLSVGVAIFCLLNFSSVVLSAYGSRTNNSGLVPLLWGCFGMAAAELFLLSMYLAFSTHGWMPRLLGSWLTSLAWLVSVAAGLWVFATTAGDRKVILHVMGISGISALVLVAAGAIGLWMLGRIQGIHWARIDIADQQRTTPLRWSILDLLVITIVIALTLALLRWLPLQFNRDQWTEFAAGMFTATIFAVMGAPVSCLVLMYLVIRCDSRHTAWRPIHLALLVGSLAVIILLGSNAQHGQSLLIACAVLAALLAYSTTVVVVLMAAHAAGWQLEWETENPAP